MMVEIVINGVKFSAGIDSEEGNTQSDMGKFVSSIQIALATLAQHGIKADVAVMPTVATGAMERGFFNVASNGESEETWTSTKLKHGFFNNKHTYNLCGGRWEQYGVAVYDDISEISPQDKQAIFSSPLGEIPFVRKVTAVIKADGKPKKVRKVEVE